MKTKELYTDSNGAGEYTKEEAPLGTVIIDGPIMLKVKINRKELFVPIDDENGGYCGQYVKFQKYASTEKEEIMGENKK